MVNLKKIIILCVTLFLVAYLTEPEIITDERTKPEIDLVEVTENTKLIVWGSDAMDRGNHDYDTLVHSDLVVELGYSEVNRGDVIYYETPEEAIERNPRLPEKYI